jgi:hypothetical protein
LRPSAFWKPKAPTGYSAPCCVVTVSTTPASPSPPNTRSIWCLRNDLTQPGGYNQPPATLSTFYYAPNFPQGFSCRQVTSVDPEHGIPQVNEGRFSVTAGTFWLGGSQSQPTETPLVVMLTVRSEFEPKVAPEVKTDDFKKLSETPRFHVPQELSSRVYLPLTAFFDPGDRKVLDNIANPFFSISLRRSWTLRGVHSGNPPNYMYDTISLLPIDPSVGRSDSILTLERPKNASAFFKLRPSGYNFNAPLWMLLRTCAAAAYSVGELLCRPNGGHGTWTTSLKLVAL